jgi:adenylosuccinate synthase
VISAREVGEDTLVQKVFLISGPIAVGKSAFTNALIDRFGAKRVSTRKWLLKKQPDADRAALIKLGVEEDQQTAGKWVLDSFLNVTGGATDDTIWIVDAVRTKDQIRHFREALGTRIVHLHLTAPIGVLRQRYRDREAALQEFESYDEARKHGTEATVHELKVGADHILDASKNSPESLIARATAGLGLYPLKATTCVDVLVGAQYGSEGKGNICAWIAKDYQVLMRVGGPNAGHKVASPKYTYIQLPSGTKSNPDAKILIGAGATSSVTQVLKEIEELELTPDRLSIDPQAMIIEETDKQQEVKTLEVIGSTKKGVGVATARKILGRDGEDYWGSKVRLACAVPEFRDFILEKAYAAGHKILLEGTQGTDLSLHHGSYPHVTSRETTASGCLADAGIAPTRVRHVIMVMRSYPIRVGGTSGPMMKESSFQAIADRSGVPLNQLQRTEIGTVSGKTRRIGEFDWDQVRRAASINGATQIALTFADYIDVGNREAKTFDVLTPDTKTFIAEVEAVTITVVTLIARAFADHVGSYPAALK